MKQTPKILLWVVLGLCGALSGCHPRDPLEWKISSATPAEYEKWADHTFEQLPLHLRTELSRAILLLQGDSGRSGNPRSMNDAHNKLCLRMHRRTIRQVILDGYHVETVFLLNRMALKTDQVMKNLHRSETIAGEPKKLEQFETTMSRQEDTIEFMKMRLAEVKARVADLSAPAR